MNEALELTALVAGGFAVGLVNVIAGGGTLISMPLLIFLGLPATSANGTARPAILIQGLTAIWAYHQRGAIPWRRVAPLTIPVILGAAGGALLATRTSADTLETVLGAVTLGAALLVALRPDRALGAGEETGARRRWLLWIGLLAAGIYGGYVQAGVGYVLLAAVTMLGGWSLAEANVAKVLLVTAYTPVVLGIFTGAAQIELVPAAALSVGAAVGGYVGVLLALERGAIVIRVLLVVTAIGAGLKLLL